MSALSPSDLDNSVIPSISDLTANAANMAAIDKLVKTEKYRHIVAWGKWLGFTPQAVQKSVEQAEAKYAPEDAVQKLDGRWLCLGDISNATNRRRVEAIAHHRETGET